MISVAVIPARARGGKVVCIIFILPLTCEFGF